jgi:hypothetical protein
MMTGVLFLVLPSACGIKILKIVLELVLALEIDSPELALVVCIQIMVNGTRVPVRNRRPPDRGQSRR